MPNRLAGETSPYLLQHSNNPVDWMPWGGDALARAKLLDRPIFLSIGYAACHWCHVMERESFEDEATARLLNERFVSIKVDREERPDLDAIYMAAVQAMTGGGGWPMSVFLTPDGQPFYGGTYFPDQPRHGMPSFRQVLDGVSEAWTTQRGEVLAAGQRLVSALVEQSRVTTSGDVTIDRSLFESVNAALEARFDTRNGSWGGAPKFPQPMTLEYLLRRMAAGDSGPAAMLRFTLEKMADGGIRDQLGGGFHRYATDERWLVPHFEQMLYDNAQLARVYLHAAAVFPAEGGGARYREVAVGVLDYMLRELRRGDGVFASSQDADTEGIEGLTFTWRAPEVHEVLAPLGDGVADRFAAAYGVTEEGNWEDVTILSRAWPDVNEPLPRDDPEAEGELARARVALLERRSTRPQPARDDKALAAWNGLAIAAFAEAGRILGEERYTAAAIKAAEAITGGLLADDGSLRRSWKDGRAVGAGVLEDYTHLAEGLLALYETTFDERWFTVARRLVDTVLTRFEDPAGGFFDTAIDHERLITRPKDPQDNAVPSGGAMAATVLLRLAAFTGEGRYRDAAERAIGTVAGYLPRYPAGFAQWLVAASFAAGDSVEVAVVGEPEGAATRELLAPVWSRWRPFQVMAVASPEAAPMSVVPLLHDRVAVDGRPTAYVCRDFVCSLPVTTVDGLIDQLAARPG
ncbi:MAG TPA: thioredoxin domain-containing protein [Candidatus Limnocylindrales bacterium]|nr:thioredoxin domain-containing protein [Candidatus Limnocylindrales bacterium]